MKGYGNYDKYPEIAVEGTAVQGYDAVARELLSRAAGKDRFTIVFDCYPGVDVSEVERGLASLGAAWFHAEDGMMTKEAYNAMIRPFVTDDRVFGVMNTLKLTDVIDRERAEEFRARLARAEGIVCVIGVGASLFAEGDLLVYLDLARWEIQCRFARGATNWNTDNDGAGKLEKFKQGFFVEWRMADRHKRTLFDRADYLLDTNAAGCPKLITGECWRRGMDAFVRRPFRLVPYFAPEVWGGQWMKEVCDLDRSARNYAWAFDGVPEENSLFMRFGDVRVEIPAVDVVFYRPRLLLGERVHARFGDEYPIRFDFLDTMGGQNLSLQVHPLTEYIQNTFGMHYTQDESYYILDCAEGACVYLGLKEGIDPGAMLRDLERAQSGEIAFPAEEYVNRIPVKKHDHLLIPGGTVHCSGADTMVLEISATPYIFTFKLWDWARLGLDGRPRPVHLGHGRQVIQWDRTTEWVYGNLVDRFETVAEEEGYREEHTGLHEREFIETRRLTLGKKREFATNGSVLQGNVVEGRGAVIESPDGTFGPFEVHYAETFIIPENVKKYSIRPLDEEVRIVLAYVRG